MRLHETFWSRLSAVLFLSLATALSVADGASAKPHEAVGAGYVYGGSIDAGAPGFWDYATFNSGRLYLAHVDSVAVIDTATHKLAGEIGPLDGAHGIAIDPSLGRGFVTTSGDGAVTEFDLSSLHIVKKIALGVDADGIVFDPHSGAVIVSGGQSKQLVILNPSTGAIEHRVDLPGSLEFLAANGGGKIFVNVASTAQLARVDIATGKVDALWKLPGCKDPGGLGYDPHTRTLFTSCANARVLAVDPSTGKTLATIPTGGYSDAILIDSRRGRVFCANGVGTLTVIQEEPHGAFHVARTIPTFLGARSGAVDSRDGALYLTYGEPTLVAGPNSPGGVRIGWSGASVAVFHPND